jgi:hypothetical protein
LNRGENSIQSLLFVASLLLSTQPTLYLLTTMFGHDDVVKQINWLKSNVEYLLSTVELVEQTLDHKKFVKLLEGRRFERGGVRVVIEYCSLM